MDTFQFKTNIMCDGCIEVITPHLNAIAGIDKWTVSLDKPVKILTVTAHDVAPGAIIKALDKAGYDAVPL